MRRLTAWAALAVALIAVVLAIGYLARPLLATESDATMRELTPADLPCGSVLGDRAAEFSCLEQAQYRGQVALGLGVGGIVAGALGTLLLVRRLNAPWWALLGTAAGSAVIVGTLLAMPVEDAGFQSTTTAAPGLACGRAYTLIPTDGVHIAYLYNPQTGPRDPLAEARCRELLAPVTVVAELSAASALCAGLSGLALLPWRRLRVRTD